METNKQKIEQLLAQAGNGTILKPHHVVDICNAILQILLGGNKI